MTGGTNGRRQTCPSFYTELARLDDRDFTAVREAERLALKNVRNPSQIGMVVTLDTDHVFSADIHPPGKDTIGKRMSIMSKNMILGQSSVVFTGPLFKNATINGNKISVEYEANSLGGGLMIKDVYGQSSGGTLKEFEIAGANGIFSSSTATINRINNPSRKHPLPFHPRCMCVMRIVWHLNILICSIMRDFRPVRLHRSINDRKPVIVCQVELLK